MRKFRITTIDNVTKKEMVLTEVSYNSACMYLESLFHPIFVSTKDKDGLTEIIIDNRHHFYYDESRGLLLKD